MAEICFGGDLHGDAGDPREDRAAAVALDPERMVVRGTVLVAHRSPLVTATDV